MAVKNVAKKEEVRKIKEWSGSGTKGKKIVFYHSDPDGICSAALWLEAYPDFEPEVRQGPVMSHGFVRWLSDQDPDTVVFLDLPVDQEHQKLSKLQKERPDLNIIIIDHHIPEKNMSSSRTVHINNKFITGMKNRYTPGAYLTYRIIEESGFNLSAHKWISAIGIIGDYGHKDCSAFLRGIKDRKNIEKATKMISAAVTLKGTLGAKRALQIVRRCKSAKELAARKTLGIWKRFVDDEIKTVLEDFRKTKEEHPDQNLVLYRIKSKLNITSVISTILSANNPKKIIVIYKLSHKGIWKASLRFQDGDVDLGTLTKQCVKGMGSGGGHRQAAGARFSDWHKFRKRIISKLS